ncbi:HD domain-containing protein [Dyadobacter sp. MSC1_007]|jgi:uncharacterized protein|uniref:HD domain-containing protein n=1 Tax=Dyadobacter sp. MSC1_007 TaxID=2909264 RepID=UPI00202E5FC8|nr:HD domain-containing protein [Dyadobacter sp. MSC1_007]
MDIEKAEAYIVAELQMRLDPTLYYHGLHHVLDVVRASAEIAALEQVQDEESLILLKTAALYHDCGFISVYQGHEEAGCRIARRVLPDFGYTPGQIDKVCGMIMATMIPQNPQNQLEMILCDADLDYLGRDDFDTISATLFEELKTRDLIDDIPAWDTVQVRFISAHRYWTASEIERREAAKQRHLQQLKSRLGAL